MSLRSRCSGFSMTELLVVVAVILILLSLLLVGVNSLYSQAAALRCQHHLEQIGQAVQMYGVQNHGMLPKSWEPFTGQMWYQVLAATSLDSPNVLGCPSVGDSPVSEGGAPANPPTSRENVSAIMKALRYLKSRQVQSGALAGSFDNGTYYRTTYACSMTGLALLAYLGFGCNDLHPEEFAGTVRAAIEFLTSSVAQQKTNDGGNRGMFLRPVTSSAAPSTMYTQGICVMALAGAARVCQDPVLRQKALSSAQMGIDWIARIQPVPEYLRGNYWYNSGPVWDTQYSRWMGDLSAGAWVFHACAAAQLAGLSVPASLLASADNFFLYGTSTGGSGLYWYSPPNVASGQDRGYSNTSVGLATRLVLGQPSGSTWCLRQLNWLRTNNQPKSWLLQELSGGRGQVYTVFFNTEAMFRIGGSDWRDWYNWYPGHLLAQSISLGDDQIYWPASAGSDIGGGATVGAQVYATAMAAMSLAGAYEDHWFLPTWRPPTARCSYGYNNQLGLNRGTPASDTILLMDYEYWEIDNDAIDPPLNHGTSKVALRHGGKANALMGDGTVRALRVADIKSGMWTPQVGD